MTTQKTQSPSRSFSQAPDRGAHSPREGHRRRADGKQVLPRPAPPLATISANLAAVEAAQTVALTKVKGAVQDRDAKAAVVKEDMRHIVAYVQGIADADPTNAEAIIHSAGLSVGKTATRSKQALVAKSGLVSGSVTLVAKSAGKRASYEWELSTDQKTWTPLASTLQAHTTATSLTPATTVYFRHRAVTKVGPGDWSQVIAHVVA